MNRSRNFLICCYLIFLLGCYPSRIDVRPNGEALGGNHDSCHFESAWQRASVFKDLSYLATLKELFSESQVRGNHADAAYLAEVMGEISTVANIGKLSPCVFVIESAAAWAVVLAPSAILLTTGLIQRLETEASLYFILAHELEHLRFELIGQSDHLTRRQLELAADRFAWRVLASLRFPLMDVYQTLELVENTESFFSPAASDGYPSQEQRLAQVPSWPKVVYRENSRQFRQLLSNSMP